MTPKEFREKIGVPQKPIMLSQIIGLWSKWPDPPVCEDIPLIPVFAIDITDEDHFRVQKVTFQPAGGCDTPEQIVKLQKARALIEEVMVALKD